MTNNNNTKPTNCNCGELSVAAFVAGVQCFECETVDNNAAGVMFDTTAIAVGWWMAKADQMMEEHEAGPNFIPATGFCS
jgi:hypothetical protein